MPSQLRVNIIGLVIADYPTYLYNGLPLLFPDQSSRSPKLYFNASEFANICDLLDTPRDLLNYLTLRWCERHNIILKAASENDILAAYATRGHVVKHILRQGAAVGLSGGFWQRFIENGGLGRRRERLQPSYLVDAIIDRLTTAPVGTGRLMPVREILGDENIQTDHLHQHRILEPVRELRRDDRARVGWLISDALQRGYRSHYLFLDVGAIPIVFFASPDERQKRIRGLYALMRAAQVRWAYKDVVGIAIGRSDLRLEALDSFGSFGDHPPVIHDRGLMRMAREMWPEHRRLHSLPEEPVSPLPQPTDPGGYPPIFMVLRNRAKPGPVPRAVQFLTHEEAMARLAAGELPSSEVKSGSPQSVQPPIASP